MNKCNSLESQVSKQFFGFHRTQVTDFQIILFIVIVFILFYPDNDISYFRWPGQMYQINIISRVRVLDFLTFQAVMTGGNNKSSRQKKMLSSWKMSEIPTTIYRIPHSIKVSLLFHLNSVNIRYLPPVLIEIIVQTE